MRELYACTFASAVLLAACAAPQRGGVTYDVVIQRGTLIDGSGAPRQTLDIAIRGDRIVRIAAHIQAAGARTVIDATGMIVAPGFIEPHALVQVRGRTRST